MSEDVKENPTFPHFDTELNPNYGYVGTWEDAKAMKEFFEIRKALRFPALRTSTTFGKTDILQGKKKKYKWAEADEYVSGGAIPYDGIPFIILDKNIYECEYGVDHKLKRKARRGHTKNQKNDVESNTKKKQGAEADMGKKRNCPAKIRMKEIMKFPDFKIDPDTRYNRNKGAENLNMAIGKGAVRGERRIYIYFPSDCEHKGHELRSQVCATKQHVDGRVLCLIDHLVEEGVTLAEEISHQISLCVQDAAAVEGSTDSHAKLACPEEGDIKYHIQAAQVIHTYSKLQPEELEDHVAQLRLIYEDPYIVFRKQSAGKSLLLVHQTTEQQQTIARYANERYFWDSTCTTTKQALPLALISVQANGIHHIVGSAILQKKSSSLIQEALEVFKSWNPTWKPLSFTTEFEEEDIKGIKQAFQGVPILLCDYHRVSAWNKWVSEAQNGMKGTKGALLSILEALSNASTKEGYEKLLNRLRSSSYWTEDERLQTWFGSKWLPCCMMWAQAFFPQPSSSSPPSEDKLPEDPLDNNAEEEDISDIALTTTLRERCLQTLQRLTDIAQQDTTNHQDLVHLAACLDSAEEKYASLVSASAQGIPEEQGEEQTQEHQELEQGEGGVQEPEEGAQNHMVVEGFEGGTMKRRRVETSVKTGNIEVGQEPIFLDMFVEAVEIVYRNQETLNQEMVTGEVHQELVAGEVHQELVTAEVRQVTAEVRQVTAEVHHEIGTGEVGQQLVLNEVQQELVTDDIHQELVTAEVHEELVQEVHQEMVTNEDDS